MKNYINPTNSFKNLKLNYVTRPSARTIFIFSFFIFAIYFSCFFSTPHTVEAHFDHLAHYNGAGIGISKYYVNQQIDPEYTKPNQLSKIQFSIQDQGGHDVHNIVVMVEIYSTSTGQRISVFPWTSLSTGDFEVPFIFPKIGSYQVVASILNDNVNSSEIINTVPPPHELLNNNANCNCERAVFTIYVTETFGTIFVFVVYLSVFGAVFIFGFVLFWMYWTRRKSKFNPISNDEFIKYSVLFLALGASIVHLSVYSEHGGLRLEYSIFLISASGAQLFYGISYILLIFSDDKPGVKRTDKNLISRKYYKKSLLLNLFGLVGSMILILLYTYSVVFPPPLSPNSHPEDVDLAGIVDKSLEVILVLGIIFLMRSEKKRYLYSRSLV